MRWTVGIAAVVLAVAVSTPASALVIAMKPPVQRAITADVVIVGKVTAIEKNTVDAARFPGDPEKTAHKVAVVKIETPLVGANTITHIKIGFVPPAKPNPADELPPGRPGRPIRPIRPGLQAPELKEGQEMLFFLTKHPSGEFYIMPNMSPPVDLKDEAGKKELEAVKKIVAVIADPMKGLKSDKPEVRAETAAIMVMKYRAYPDFGGEVDQVPIPAEESRLILKALADANWSNQAAPRPGPEGNFPNAIQAFYSLGLTEQDGWKQPMFPRPQPGQPPVDFNLIVKDAFVKWLTGPGKDYQIKKIVPKK
jgi:hypothetical protein